MGRPQTVHLESVFMRSTPPKTNGWILWQQTQQTVWALGSLPVWFRQIQNLLFVFAK